MQQKNYKLFVPGDLNGFFALMFDNLTVLSFLAGILIFVFQYPAEIVFGKMFPGTAFGVLVGDLLYSYLAIRLANKTGKPNVTAMPLGLDTPSTIGIALTVLGPAFLYLKTKYNVQDAAMMTWYIGMSTMVMIGITKFIFSFIGHKIQKLLPQAGLLGSLAGIGLALIGFMPIAEIFGMPIVGVISLGIILYTLIARIQLPGKIPPVLFAVVLGTILYYIIAPLGFVGTSFEMPKLELHFGLPIPTFNFINGFVESLNYLPIAFPFALLTIAGAINVTESANVAGDDYKVKEIMWVDALATTISGLSGGVAQTTPYIGHPAYKAMGSRIGYTIITGLFVGLGGIFGYASFIVELIPRAVLAPILVFVALDIMAMAFHVVKPKYSMAVAFAYFPTVARLLEIKLTNPEYVPTNVFETLTKTIGKHIPEISVIVALGNGFILTAMLWAAFIANLIDRKFIHSCFYLLFLALLSFFGIIHSALPNGNMYLPWTLPAYLQVIPYQFSLAYIALSILFFLLSFSKQAKVPYKEEEAV